MPRYKTLLHYCSAYEAGEMARFLKKRGIAAFTAGESIGVQRPGIPVHSQLLVPKEDAAEAWKLLQKSFPQYLGDPQRIARLEREMLRQLGRLLLIVGLPAIIILLLLDRFLFH